MDLHTIKRIAAFTLAEVLITLGIVGMIAEMTIPTLMNNVNETIYYSAAKKAYSTLIQAVVMMETDPNLALDSKDENTTMASFLKVMRNMGSGTDIALTLSTNYYHYKCKAPFGPINYGQAAAYSSDSGIFLVYLDNDCSTISDSPLCSELFWDTNGLKPPNMNGYDLLSFRLFKVGGAYKLQPLGTPGSGDGYSCSASCVGIGNENTSDGCTFQRVMGLPMP